MPISAKYKCGSTNDLFFMRKVVNVKKKKKEKQRKTEHEDWRPLLDLVGSSVEG